MAFIAMASDIALKVVLPLRFPALAVTLKSLLATTHPTPASARKRGRQICYVDIHVVVWRSRLLSHLAIDEAFSGPGVDNAPRIDVVTLSFVAVVDAVPLDDRPLTV